MRCMCGSWGTATMRCMLRIILKSIRDMSFQIGVHIADVSHFIRNGTALDDEARHRGTTVYLANKRSAQSP